MSFFGFGPPLSIKVLLHGTSSSSSSSAASAGNPDLLVLDAPPASSAPSSSSPQGSPSSSSDVPRALVKTKGGAASQDGASSQDNLLPMYTTGDTVKGTVTIKPTSNKKVEHQGIRIELLGQVELFFDRGNYYDFLALSRELEPAGDVSGDVELPFEFKSCDMQHESYTGINVRLRYVLRVTVTRGYGGGIVKELPFCVRLVQSLPDINNTLKMEVGIEDCLHIEFEYSKAKYHLKDVVVGKIYFLLVRIRIKHMDLEIRRRESTGSGANTYNESETLAKFEVMDGAPVRTESIPIRIFLSPYDLTPSYKNINNKFSVKYFLNLVLVDEEDRRYFKQQEIQLWRNELI